jgi:hypothetical protein
MKLKDILIEMALEKGRWTSIPHDELRQYEESIFKLIQTAYKDIGGNIKIKSPTDVIDPRKEYEVIDLDSDNQPNAVSIGKNTPAGLKFVGTGHDGSNEAKHAILYHKLDQLKHPGYYIEASGRLRDILIAKHITVVMDKDTVEKALAGKSIEWHGDGTYTREIGGVRVEKMMLGKPLV